MQPAARNTQNKANLKDGRSRKSLVENAHASQYAPACPGEASLETERESTSVAAESTSRTHFPKESFNYSSRSGLPCLMIAEGYVDGTQSHIDDGFPESVSLGDRHREETQFESSASQAFLIIADFSVE